MKRINTKEEKANNEPNTKNKMNNKRYKTPHIQYIRITIDEQTNNPTRHVLL